MRNSRTLPLPLVGYAAAPELACLAINDIVVEADINPRLKEDPKKIRQLADALKGGVELLPPVVFRDEDGRVFMADGFGRLSAHVEAGRSKIKVEVREGTRRDAVLHGICVNATHGRRLTNKEKRRAISTIFDDPEWLERSDRDIAKMCGCSSPTVAKVREAHPSARDSHKAEHRLTRNKNGRLRRQSVANVKSRRGKGRSIDAQSRAHDSGAAISERVEVTGQNRKAGKASAASASPIDQQHMSTSRVLGSNPLDSGGVERIIAALDFVKLELGNPKKVAKAINALDDEAVRNRFKSLFEWCVEVKGYLTKTAPRTPRARREACDDN